MKIVVITAMPEEFAAVARCLGAVTVSRFYDRRTGRSGSGGNEYLLVESGMGFDNAAYTAGILLRNERPDLLVSVGFCGGVTPELQTGDVVVAEKVVIAGESGFTEVPVQMSAVGRAFLARNAAAENRVIGAVFVSTPAIMSKRKLAAVLQGNYVNPAVEMESGAIATIAAENGVPFIAVRAVTDPFDEELGFTLDEFCDTDMRRINPFRVLLTIMRKPRILPQLIRLSRGSRLAVRNLKAALPDLFALLGEASCR